MFVEPGLILVLQTPCKPGLHFSRYRTDNIWVYYLLLNSTQLQSIILEGRGGETYISSFMKCIKLETRSLKTHIFSLYYIEIIKSLYNVKVTELHINFIIQYISKQWLTTVL